LALSACLLPLAGCGGGVPAIAESNRVFYAFDSASAELRDEFERPYPPLHKKKGQPDELDYQGVAVLNGRVRLSRPTDWVLRSATNEPGRRFISYISPRQCVFAVYEWPDRPDAPWREILARYEDGLKAARAELVERRVPMATWNGQARAYVVRRKVPAAKLPYENTSLELLVRADNRVVLVQIVHQGENLALENDELMRVVQTLELL
jgi:hypothetical protein